MRKRTALIGASLGVVGALLVSGIASAAVTGISYTASVTPTKQNKKTFGPASITNNIDTFYTGGFSPVPDQTVITFSKNLKFTPGSFPQCPLVQVNNKSQAVAKANCPSSIIGGGTVTLNSGALTGVITAFNGPAQGSNPTILLHSSINNDALDPVLVGVLNSATNVLTVSIPNTGVSITNFSATVNKVKTGKKKVKVNGKTKQQPVYYVMARCKKNWTNVATTTFHDGSTHSSTSTQKCKQKK